MGGDNMDFGAINAKMKAMHGRLLTYEDYNSLCNLKSVDELGRRLKEYPVYGKVMPDIGDRELHRGYLEQKIVLSLHEDFLSIYKFISNFDIRNFLERFFIINEIHTIKLLLCTIYDERDINYTLPELHELLGNKLKIDVLKLKNSKNVPEFINNLAGTEFYNILANVYTENTPLFKLETQLDLYYYINLWKAKNKYLDKVNSKLVNKLVGTEIDSQNILWIFRLKKYYNMPSSLIYTYLIPINYNLKTNILSRMVEAKSVEDLTNEIQNSPYAKFFSEEIIIETNFYKEQAKIYKNSEIMYQKSLAVTLSYIFLKKLEIKNIISLVEGIRYKLEPKEILKYITLPKNEEAS